MQAMSHLPYPSAISFMASTFFWLWLHFSAYCPLFLLITHTDIGTQTGFTLPYYLKAALLCKKLWGAAGVVRSFQYQIWHKGSIHTRLNHHHCLLGILTITSLVFQGRGTDGGRGALMQRRGKTDTGCCEGNVFFLNTGLPD